MTNVNQKLCSLRLYVLLVGLMSLAVHAGAQQSAKGLTIKSRPAEYANGPSRILPKNVVRLDGVSRSWTVFSDRDDNPVYQEPNLASQVVDKLPFRLPLIVVDETDEFIQVAEFKSRAFDYNTYIIKEDVRLYGWIPKTHALLWNRPMIDPTSKFRKKCIAVNSIKTLNDIPRYAQNDSLVIYSSPGGPKRSGAHVRLYTFLFIFKEQGDYVLVSPKTQISSLDADESIYGWISRDIIQLWTHRLALEPTGDGAGYERKSKLSPIRVFPALQDATAYGLGSLTESWSNEIPFQDPYDERLAPDWYRLPFLGYTDESKAIIHSGLISKVYNSDGQAIIDLDEQLTLNREYEAIREEKSNVNIVFVLDGSQSMQQYAKPVCTAIRDAAVEIAGQDIQDCHFEYGAVVYRSFEEGTCGNQVIQTKSLTVNEQDVVNFLSSDILRQDCSSKGELKAVYKGLDEALNMLRKRTQTNQTNIIILIGGAGNDEEKEKAITRETLIEKIALSRTSLMCFQVKSNESQAFWKFGTDVKDLIRRSSEAIQAQYKSIYTDAARIELGDDPNDESLVRLNYPGSAPVPGSLIWSRPMVPMKSNRLKDEIEGIIFNAIDNNKRLFANGDTQIRGAGKRFEMDEATRNFLSQMNVDVDLLQRASQENLQFFMEGYTPMKRRGLEKDMFSFVIFLEDTEFESLLSQLKALADPGLALTDKRDKLEDGFRRTAASYLGPGESKDVINALTLENVVMRMFGLPGSENFPLLKMRIQDISRMDSLQIDELARYFLMKYQNLSDYRLDIRNVFIVGGERFYWVPQRLLP